MLSVIWCPSGSGIVKVGTGMAQAQPILSIAQPTLLLIKWVVLQIPPATYTVKNGEFGKHLLGSYNCCFSEAPFRELH